MAKLNFSTTKWGALQVRTPDEMGRGLVNGFLDTFRYVGQFDLVSETGTDASVTARLSNGGVFKLTGSGFEGDVAKVRTISYSEPANKLAFSASTDLTIDAEDGTFSGSIYKERVKLINGNELSCSGKITFRFPDLARNPFGTSARLNECKCHFCPGFRVCELLRVEFLQKSSDGSVVDGVGHPVDANGQGIGWRVGFDVAGGDEQLADQRAGIVFLLQMAA